jgi:hypothetical protein
MMIVKANKRRTFYSTFPQNVSKSGHLSGQPLGYFWHIQKPSQDWSGFWKTFIPPEGEMTNSAFARRQNNDSTTDLICLGCFQTVARVEEEADLAAAEIDHACDPYNELLSFQSRSQREIIS